MRSPTRFLRSSDPARPADPPSPLPVDSDVVVILATLLCALICVVGLALAARCAWIRRSLAAASPSAHSPPAKGLKKEAVRALPTLSYASPSAAVAADPGPALGVDLLDCAICLSEFSDGDVVRVLPPCGHGFHAECVDAWLRSRSSCPSCRRILQAPPAPSRCQKCGASSGVASKAPPSGTFLP